MQDPDRTTGTVALFATCLADIFRPQVAMAAAKLIQQCGYTVHVPSQSCCGQPAYNSGDRKKTRELAILYIREFESYDYIVAPSGSCAAMISEHYLTLFDKENEWYERCRQVCNRTWELSRFLVEVANAVSDNQTAGIAAGTGLMVTYHDSCSGLRELGIRLQPRKLLKQRLGIDICELTNAEICCGFGGMFCVKYPEISTRMVENKIDGIVSSQAEILLGGDLGCLLNIGGRLKRQGSKTRVYHFAELLAESDPGPAIGQSGED